MHSKFNSYSPVPLTAGCARHVTWTGRIPIGTTSSSTSSQNSGDSQTTMATASKPLGGNTNYVFKMQYDAGGSAPMHRRYGYAGELALPQVYEVSQHLLSGVTVHLLISACETTGPTRARESNFQHRARERCDPRPRQSR